MLPKTCPERVAVQKSLMFFTTCWVRYTYTWGLESFNAVSAQQQSSPSGISLGPWHGSFARSHSQKLFCSLRSKCDYPLRRVNGIIYNAKDLLPRVVLSSEYVAHTCTSPVDFTSDVPRTPLRPVYCSADAGKDLYLIKGACTHHSVPFSGCFVRADTYHVNLYIFLLVYLLGHRVPPVPPQ